MAAKFRASGQTCVCANRVYVQEGIYDTFVGQLAKVVENRLIPGDPMSTSTTIGPLINTKAVRKVERLVDDACRLGAEVVTGGSRSNRDPETF